MEETPLQFGNVSNAVKVGDTIHRDTGPWTPTVHALLNHLNDKGFSEAPHVLGFDEKGREILSFLPGIEASRPWPEVLLVNDGVTQAGHLLRKYHDIVADFVPPENCEWRAGKIDLKKSQIVRHGDLGPWNTIWTDNILTGLIDWDFAQPGERLEDLAQMAYYFVPLRGDDGWMNAGFAKRPVFAERLDALVFAYGMYSKEEVIEAVFVQQEAERDIVLEKGQKGTEPWVSFLKRGDVEESRKDVDWLNSIKAEILS